MDIDDLLGIDNSDPVHRLADELVRADDHLLEELVELRRRTMTQAEVAVRLGISRPAVAAFERYDADPRLSTIRRYALAIRAHIAHSVTPESDRQQTAVDLASLSGEEAGKLTAYIYHGSSAFLYHDADASIFHGTEAEHGADAEEGREELRGRHSAFARLMTK